MFGMARKEGATVVRVLAEQLRRDIAFGVLAPDGRLKIDALRRSYGGSAHSLREALTHLTNDGLVEASDQRGFRVASATQADLDDITRLRIEIERLGLAWSIERGDVGWEGSVIAALHGYMRAAADLADAPAERALDWEEAGRAFHASLLAACRSPRLARFQNSLYHQSRRFRLSALSEGGLDIERLVALRQAVVDHALARRSEEAAKALTLAIQEDGGAHSGQAPA